LVQSLPMLEVLKDPALEKMTSIQHGFFTREGGVSTGIHASLNCAYPSYDQEEAIQENLRRALSHFGYPLTALCTVRNVHSNTAVIVDPQTALSSTKPLADAMVTQHPDLILGSDSADCPIVLLADEKAKVIGLAHAGWKGAKAGILEATLEKMCSLGARVEQIAAAISPCIAQASYEVSPDFYQQFLSENAFNQTYFKTTPEQAYFFDLLNYVKDRLKHLKLTTISSEVAFDTYTDEKRFFSCRRAKHREEPYFGGQLSCILRCP
jgi:YfiH family protein